MINIYIGYDPDEIAAYHVLANSIIRQASQPVAIIPVATHLVPIDRPHHPKQSNTFAFSRFLVPHLQGFRGWAIWMDADMLCRADIAQLWAWRDPDKAIQVVKKDYWPEDGKKFLGRPQSSYPALADGTNRTLCSAMMLMNCAACKELTPEYVNRAEGLDLHQFKWVNDHRIGELPPEWQHVVEVDPPREDAKLVHFSLGGPWFTGFDDVEFAAEWRQEMGLVNGSDVLLDSESRNIRLA
jgi:lipopolysaccharide biosynthesis glycosyltransferase